MKACLVPKKGEEVRLRSTVLWHRVPEVIRGMTWTCKCCDSELESVTCPGHEPSIAPPLRRLPDGGGIDHRALWQGTFVFQLSVSLCVRHELRCACFVWCILAMKAAKNHSSNSSSNWRVFQENPRQSSRQWRRLPRSWRAACAMTRDNTGCKKRNRSEGTERQ